MTNNPAADTTAQDEDQADEAAEVAEPGVDALPGLPAALTDDATADEFDVVAAVLARYARDAQARAEQAKVRAGAIETEAQAEIERITRESRAEAQRLRWTVAQTATREAEEYHRQASATAEVAKQKRQASEEAQRGIGLAAEREALASQVEELDGRIAELTREKRDLESRLSVAREAADADLIAALRTQIAGREEALEVLSGKRSAAQARMDAIAADNGQGELYNALTAARRHVATARELANAAWPDRPEAVADHQQTELMAALEGNLQRLADERRAARQQPPRQIVHL